MKYGDLPKVLGHLDIKCKEMMFYQYLPIKLAGGTEIRREDRVSCFDKFVSISNCDFVADFGLKKWVDSYIYLSCKYMWQSPGNSYNRMGWHADGFMTDDINYLWSDNNPTIFNTSDFSLSEHDRYSLQEMQEQANPYNDVTFPNSTILRLDRYNVHRVADIKEGHMRTFAKLSISKDKYELLGNAHNYLLDYNWELKERIIERNVPQS